jgi:hypothetical protein
MNNATRGRLLEAKTVAWLESLGYRAGIVGKRGRHGVDLFGCCDLVSVHPEHGVELHQVTTKTNASGRRRKIRDANLGWPVRLWLWSQGPNRRWVSTSEVVMPVEVGE